MSKLANVLKAGESSVIYEGDFVFIKFTMVYYLLYVQMWQSSRMYLQKVTFGQSRDLIIWWRLSITEEEKRSEDWVSNYWNFTKLHIVNSTAKAVGATLLIYESSTNDDLRVEIYVMNSSKLHPLEEVSVEVTAMAARAGPTAKAPLSTFMFKSKNKAAGAKPKDNMTLKAKNKKVLKVKAKKSKVMKKVKKV